jgi:hypothetical protein
MGAVTGAPGRFNFVIVLFIKHYLIISTFGEQEKSRGRRYLHSLLEPGAS